MLCRAALCVMFEHTGIPVIMRSTTYQEPMCTWLYLYFSLLIDCLPSRSSSWVFRKLRPYYCRSERDIANKHTGQHRRPRKISFALCTSSSWHYQIACCRKSRASSFCPLHIYLKYSMRWHICAARGGKPLDYTTNKKYIAFSGKLNPTEVY